MSKTLTIEDPREEIDEISPVKELTQVALNPGSPDHLVSIGSLLSPELQGKLVQFLQQNQDVFAWSHKDIPKINPQIMSHRLNVDPSFAR